MEKLLLVGGDIATPEAIKYCREIGVYTIMTNDLPYENNPYKQMADEAWEIPVEELDVLEAKCREAGVTAVFAGVNEHNLDMTQALAKRLGLPFYASDEGWCCARDKGRFKEHCMAVGLDVAKRYDVAKPFSTEKLSTINYPVIVKPADSCGSQGLTVCYSEAELLEAFDKALGYSAAGDVIVEDYIDGNEFMFFFCFIDGKPFTYFFSSQQLLPINGRSIVSFGTLIKQNWEKWEKKYNDKLEALFKRIGCTKGCGFFQGACKDDKYYLFEMGYRLDGLATWRNIQPMMGFNPLEIQVDVALGRIDKTYDMIEDCKIPKLIRSVYMIYPKPGKIKSIVGVNQLEKNDKVSIALNRYKEGNVVAADNSMYQIALVLNLETKDEQHTKELLKTVNETIHFYDEDGNDMLYYFEDYSIFGTSVEN